MLTKGHPCIGKALFYQVPLSPRLQEFTIIVSIENIYTLSIFQDHIVLGNNTFFETVIRNFLFEDSTIFFLL